MTSPSATENEHREIVLIKIKAGSQLVRIMTLRSCGGEIGEAQQCARICLRDELIDR